MKSTLQVLSLVAICLLGFTARLWNVRDVFVDGRIYFVDADCYSRMTRAEQVSEGRGWVIRHHDFENWPAGTTPHTTAPLDWLIVAGKGILDFGFWILDSSRTSVLRGQTLDLSGALIGPVLGALTCGILAFVGMRLRWRGWAAPAVFCAVSPVLVHGTVLGRPDHQALLIPLLALALASELALARNFSRGWGIASGVAWAVALWTSLYEPLVLLGVVAAFWLVANRRRFTAPELRPGWIAFGATLAAALLIDGWRLSWPDAALRAAFENWEKTIGELAHLDLRGPLLQRWIGGENAVLFYVALAVIAIFRRRELALPAAFALTLFVATFALTIWQVRWGYFFALACALLLRFLFEQARSERARHAVFSAAVLIFLFLLWPMAADWDEKLFPDDHPELDLEKQRGVLRLESLRLREVAEAMRGPERQPFVAPWWLSPPLAYWSGQPGVAGSSHESLPGILASARFFLAPDAATSEQIARDLGVKWIVTDDSDRTTDTARVLLGVPASATPSFIAHLHEIAEPRERVRADDVKSASPMARAQLAALADQAEAAHLGTAAFSCVSTNQFYKLFAVKPTPTP